ncbi:MAG TPA: class F sortase [Sporichthyaceae bacterium]|jgi:hypothetical protein|nr:class F sortase [Sporichthyaceae bacterium]
MTDGKARVLALTGAGVLSQVGMTLLIVGLSFGKMPPPAPPRAGQAAAIGFSSTGPTLLAQSGPEQNPLGPVTPLTRSTPIRLTVPRVGINTALMQLGLQSDGEIEVPPDDSTAPAGWYRNLATPGEAGTSVIVGHLDSPQAPAVFFNLGAMRPGDHLSVLRADGSTAHFTVTEVGSYPRDQFPSEAVYGPSTTPVLRLITCGGQYHKGDGYEGNVVVFADMDPDVAPVIPARPSSTPTPAATAAPSPTHPPTRTREPASDSASSDESSSGAEPTPTNSPAPESSPSHSPSGESRLTHPSSTESSTARSSGSSSLRSSTSRPTSSGSSHTRSSEDSDSHERESRPVYHRPAHREPAPYVPPQSIPQ